jgi:ABC-2 type transport system permease protein
MDEAIVVPEKLTEKLANGEDISLIHISSGKNMIRSSVVESFLRGFRDATNAGINIESVIKSYDFNTNEAASIQVGLIDKYGTSFVNLRTINNQEATNLGSFQYFSVSMLIFFLLTSGMGLGIGIIDDRTDRLYSRICSYSVTNNQYLLGKALGNGVIGIFQAAIIIIFTSLAFKVNWGNNYPGLAIVVIAVLFSSSGLAVILSNLLNSSKALSTALIVIYWSITFVSGSFVPIPAFEPAGRFTLNKWAFEVITGFMAGKGFRSVANYLLMLISLCLILWLIGIMLYRRRAANE